VTVYDTLPWIEIVNDRVSQTESDGEYLFHFASERPRVSWEIPGGYDEARAAVTDVEHLRWLRLTRRAASVLVASMEATRASVFSDGTLISKAPRGSTRYRVLPRGWDMTIEETWRFGTSVESLLAVPVEPGRRGRLPRFGSLLVVDPPTAGIVGLTTATDGDGIVVYLLDMSGTGGLVALTAGLLRFGDARRVDFLERDLGDVAGRVQDGVLVSVPARGAAAVRLRDVELNRT
jgi:hypothetical protein